MKTVFGETLLSFEGKQVTFNDMIKQAGLDFEVTKCRLIARRPVFGDEIMSNLVAIYRKDDGAIVSQRGVGKKYEIVQIGDALKFCEYLIDQNYATYGYAGAPGKGARAYVILKAAGAIDVSEKDKIENWFTVSTSHDGTGKIEVRTTPVFPKIGAVLTPSQGKNLSFKHTKNVQTHITQAMKTIKRITSEWDNAETQLRTMMRVKITEEMAAKYFESVIDSDDIENSARALNIKEQMMTTYKSGTYRMIPSMCNTVFGAYATVLEWCDKQKTVRKSEIRTENEAKLYTKISGSAAKQKAEAHGFAWKMCALRRDPTGV